MRSEIDPAVDTQRQEDLVLSLVDGRTGVAPEATWKALESIPATPRFPTPESIRDYVREVQALNAASVELDFAFSRLGEEIETSTEPPSEIFKFIDNALASLFVAQLTLALPEDSQISKGLSDIFHRFTWKAVEPGSAASSILRDKFCDMQHIRGELVRTYVERNPHAAEHLNPAALIEYKRFGYIADATNQFFLKWERDCGGILNASERRANGFTNEVATIRYNDEGKAVEVPWHEAFPEEIGAIVAAYSDLVADLERGFDGPVFDDAYFDLMGRKIEYYKAVLEAWKSSDIEDWRDADALLPQQTAGLNEPVHIHTIERGYGKDAMQRVPEASLRCPDASEKAINDRALVTRATVSIMAERFLRNIELTNESKNTVGLIRRSNFAARHFMGAGMEMIFMPAGQILPNATKTRMRSGLDISANPKTMKDRMALIREAFKIVFGYDMPEPDFVELNGGDIASHEFSHPVGITENTERNIGHEFFANFIEEWKASVAGLIFNQWMPFLAHKEEWLGSIKVPRVTLKELRNDIVHHIALCPRYTAKRSEPNTLPYLRKSYLLMNVAQETGILYKESGAWRIDVSKIGLVYAFFGVLETQLRKVLKIYDTGTANDLRKFLARHLRPTPFLEESTAKLDAHYGKTGLPSVADLCRVP